MNNYYYVCKRITDVSNSVAIKVLKYQQCKAFFASFPRSVSVIILIVGILQLPLTYSFLPEWLKFVLTIVLFIVSFFAIYVDAFNTKKTEYENAISTLRKILTDLEKHHRKSTIQSEKEFDFEHFYEEMDNMRSRLHKSDLSLWVFPVHFKIKHNLENDPDFQWIALCKDDVERFQKIYKAPVPDADPLLEGATPEV